MACVRQPFSVVSLAQTVRKFFAQRMRMIFAWSGCLCYNECKYGGVPYVEVPVKTEARTMESERGTRIVNPVCMICVASVLLSGVALAADDNLLRNGGFEGNFAKDGTPAGWVINDYQVHGRYERLSVDAPEGNSALKVTVSDYDGGSAMIVNGAYPFKAGRLYEFSALLRSDDGCPIGFQMRQRGMPYHDFVYVTVRPEKDWQRYVFRQVLTRDDDVAFRFVIRANGSVCIDDVRIREVTPDTPLMLEALLADSKYPVVYPRGKPPSGVHYNHKGKNILRNGSFELGMEGWAFNPTDWGDAHLQKENLIRAQPTLDGSQAAVGAKSLCYTGPGKVSNPWELSSRYVFLNPGKRHVLSFWAKTTDSNDVGIRIGSGEAFSRTLSWHARQSFRLSNAFRRYEMVITNLPYANDNAYFLVFQGATRGKVWLDGIQLEEASSASAYKEHSSVEAALSVDEQFGLVRRGTPAHLRLKLRNAGAETTRISAAIDGVDVFGVSNLLRRVAVTLAPGKTHEESWEWRGEGFWALAAHGDFPMSETLVQFIPEQPKAEFGQSMFGAHFQLNRQSIEFAKLVGYKANRMHPPIVTRWNTVEHEKGKWKFFDDALTEATTNGIAILGLLYGTPPWACCDEKRRSNGAPSGHCACSPTDVADWRNYVRTVATRYRKQIRWWEMWNEADGGFFLGRTSRNYAERAPEYAELALAAREELDKVDPDLKLITGSACHMPPTNWIEPVLAQKGMPEASDAVSIHVYYTTKEFPIYGKMTHEIMSKHGIGDKPYWHTEYGIGMPRTCYRDLYEYGAGERTALDDAITVVQSLAWNAAAGFEKLFYYTLNSSRRSWRRECSAYREWDGKARFAAGATAVYIALVENHRFVRQLPDQGEVRAFLFSGADTDVIVFWKEGDGSAPFASPLAGGHLLDMDGTAVEKPEARRWPRYLVLGKRR